MSSPTKKRKANNSTAHGGSTYSNYDNIGASARATDACRRSDNTSPDSHGNEQLIQQMLSLMQNMNQMMARMEEKLDNLSNVESRCVMLEAKCSSLETKLEATSQLMKDRVEKLEGKVEAGNMKAQQNHEYSQMMLRSQTWEYSAQVRSYEYWMTWGYERGEKAEYLQELSKQLKEKSIEMRRGNFPDKENRIGVKGKGILLCPEIPTFAASFHNELLPHWREFLAAINQFSPAMYMLPEEYVSFFEMSNVVLDQTTIMVLKKALIGAPFSSMRFEYNLEVEDGMSLDAIFEIVKSHKHLRHLQLAYYEIINNQDVDGLCNAVKNNPSLVELDLYNCTSDSNVGNTIMTFLITNCGSKLEKLTMASCWLNSDVSALLAEFISTNQTLLELDISENMFNESDAVLIVNALQRNTTLRVLYIIESGAITNSSVETLRSVLYDDSSLNAVSDSNHSCKLVLDDEYPWNLNTSAMIKVNRGKKIYTLLSRRHRDLSTSNVQHFSDIDVKLLPDMLKAVHGYSEHANEYISEEDRDKSESKVGCLSIVYEVMRKWEKVYSLYESS